MVNRSELAKEWLYQEFGYSNNKLINTLTLLLNEVYSSGKDDGYNEGYQNGSDDMFHIIYAWKGVDVKKEDVL